MRTDPVGGAELEAELTPHKNVHYDTGFSLHTTRSQVVSFHYRGAPDIHDDRCAKLMVFCCSTVSARLKTSGTNWRKNKGYQIHARRRAF